MIFETHAHYDDEAFDGDRDELLKKMHDHGIGKIINVGASLKGVRDTAALTEKYSFVYGAAGIHPDEVGNLTEEDMKEMRSLCSKEKIVAVGEIGLDYYWDKENHDVQKKWFVRQMDLAKETELPIIVHSRNAAKDTLDIMKAERADHLKGVIHCYSYSVEMAREYVKMGYYIGIGGVVTFKNAKKLVNVVKEIPLTSIVLETDCPYLAPVPYRGKRNSSLYLPYVAEKIAEIKGVSTEEVVRQTEENSRMLYDL